MTDAVVFVGNVDAHAPLAELTRLFTHVAPVLSVERVWTNAAKTRSVYRVAFPTAAAAVAALALDRCAVGAGAIAVTRDAPAHAQGQPGEG